MGTWTVVCFICMAVNALKWVKHTLQSVMLSYHSIIIINHSNSTLTCKALSSPRDPPSIAYATSLWATFPSASALISLSIMLPLYTPSFLFPSHPPPPHCYRQCFRLFPLTVYLIQSKLLHSSQTLITAFDNLVVCLSITPHFPPLYVGVALHHCMTDYHCTLSLRTLF